MGLVVERVRDASQGCRGPGPGGENESCRAGQATETLDPKGSGNGYPKRVARLELLPACLEDIASSSAVCVTCGRTASPSRPLALPPGSL